MDILLATHNFHKVEEIKQLLSNTNINLISLKDLNDEDDVDENGHSFEENARIKAEYYYQKYHLPVLADDSGLVIPSFDYRPGIYSARYAGINANAKKNNEKLLADIKDIKDRNAYFICQVCYIENDNIYFFTGKLEGQIAYDIRGHEGFGYDPLFILENGLRLSEIPLSEKNKISHRAQAFKNWLQFIKDRGIIWMIKK